ncbi:MAG: tRNA uridine-5-carboxymethylaminomethyl(34) synthesis GTPase MnmE [Clostridia bacterium]|nr:tRNA uridine-5-carboxymethylaminomethyl(34) synthesis GTPase MnmE [Clostridia bacterium]
MIHDTIAAIATSPGQGGVSIVRMSGPDAESILMRLFRPAGKSIVRLESHMLTYGHVTAGDECVDECMAVIMRAPRSYTREDVCEIQLHGGSYACQRTLEICLEQGARLAQPGEFTRRAFLNGRIDLSQAEAVMGLIAAQGEQAHRTAMQQLQGGASAFIRQAADELYGIQAGAAACIDYPEEISDEEAAGDLTPRILRLARTLEEACCERSARILRTGLNAALCGRPNVGKSSLLNALTGEERAIVTEIPGTTRDIVSGEILLGGSVIHLTDTAGLRDTEDRVERIGVERARRAVDQADAVLLVLDASQPLSDEDRELLPCLTPDHTAILLNKSDLPPALTETDAAALLPGAQVISLSAHDPQSLEPVKDFLRRMASVTDRLALTQPRHLEAARRAAAHLRDAAGALETATVDLAAVDLQSAQLAMAEITGDQVEERLLDRVFSEFCVGK